MTDQAVKKILVVEDERPMTHALEMKLKNAGFEVKSTYNGEEAISAIKEENFDLILLDLMMPGKDGFSVLSEMRSSENKTPVIVLSNLGQKEDIERARGLGARDYFVKSNISINEIIKKIQKI